MNRMNAGRAYGWAAFCFSVAVVFGVLGGIQLWNIHSLRLRGEVVLGQVVGSDRFHCSGRACTSKYRDWIEVEYVTLAGQRIRQRMGNFPVNAAVGGSIGVRYDREHPRHVQDAHSSLSYTVHPAVSGSITALFLVFAVLLLRKRRRDD